MLLSFVLIGYDFPIRKFQGVDCMKIALVSCTKLKANYLFMTREMYQESNLFKKAVQINLAKRL